MVTKKRKVWHHQEIIDLYLKYNHDVTKVARHTGLSHSHIYRNLKHHPGGVPMRYNRHAQPDNRLKGAIGNTLMILALTQRVHKLGINATIEDIAATMRLPKARVSRIIQQAQDLGIPIAYIADK